LRHLAFAFFISAILLQGCASSRPKTDAQLGPIKEYEDRVKVKPLDSSSPESTPVPLQTENIPKEGAKPKATPTPPPPIGIEPVIKKAIKKRKKKAEAQGAPPSDVAEAASSSKHFPDIEDGTNFIGRRPIADPFRIGEKVTLMVTYFGVSAGDATLEVKPFVEVNGRKAYHFYSKLNSSSVFSMFYKVDDYGEAFLDYEQMIPINFTISAVETKQIMDVRAFFDWKNMKVDYWRKRVTQEDGVQETKTQWPLEPFAQNTYSALQYIRLFPMKVGETYRYKVADDGKLWEVKAKALRKEILKTDLGTFPTTVVEPSVEVGGVFKPMGEVLFWFTDDDRKFLVKFEAKIKIGKLIGYLKGLDRGGP